MKKQSNKKQEILKELYKREKALFNEIIKGTAYAKFKDVQFEICERGGNTKKTISTEPEDYI